MTSDEPGHAAGTGLAAALLPAVERMREVSGADIVALYPFDAETGTFYAPIAIGLPESSVVRALPDMAEQLRHFQADKDEGKVPDDLLPKHYGPAAWLMATRRPLIATDAQQDVEGSFIRRNKIYALIGLPLLIGGDVAGLLYLNYVDHGQGEPHRDLNDPAFLARIEQAADDLTSALDAARRADELATLRVIGEMVSRFSALPPAMASPQAQRERLEAALHNVLDVTGVDAAALYAAEQEGAPLELVVSHGCPDVVTRVPVLPLAPPDVQQQAFRHVHSLSGAELHPVALLSPRRPGQPVALLLADEDPLTLQRRTPVTRVLLQTSTDLIGAMLDNGRLVAALDDTNRTLGAVTRLNTRLLQPGASQSQVLQTAVVALTDPALPELDFEFANLYLLGTAPDGSLEVQANAGTTTSPAIDAVQADVSRAPHAAALPNRRVPRWVADHEVRPLDAHDILSYVATTQRVVVIGALDAPDDDQFVTGYPEDRLERLTIEVRRGDGSSLGRVKVALLRDSAGQSYLRPAGLDADGTYRPTDEFTLNEALFSAYGHAALLRVFVPFGSDGSEGRATGVLEAGYHLSHRRRLERVQIEALRACAAGIAVAVETARLYEDVARRAQQLQIVSEVSRAITTSIDLDQTLALVARHMARTVDASACFIALLEEDGSAWYGAAASDSQDIWHQRRVERPARSIVFEVAERGRPMAVEDAEDNELVSPHMARMLGVRSLLALPLITADGGPIGAVLLAQRDRRRIFTQEEVDRVSGLAGQAAMAIRNARLHAREEEEQHIQKDVVLVGFGQWGQKAYQHLLLLKSFFNFRTHVVEHDRPGRREALAEAEQQVLANGDLFYWDSPATPARDALALELEPSCYVITYIATPAETHLPLLKSYYGLSNVILIEKPLGAPPDEYRAFLDTTDGSVQIVAADHYWFKLEVRLLELLLTEERNLRAFLDEIEEVEIEILEEQPPGGSGAQIGMIADLIPHAFAVLSLLTPLDRLKPAPRQPLRIGCYEPKRSDHETYARLVGYFDHQGRQVRVTIDVGKGVMDSKWIKLIGERRMGGRRSFYKFDFIKGEAIDGTQSALRAATRPIRQPGVPDTAHLSMLRHVIEKKHPAVGILSIREALRANARIQQLEHMAADLMAAGKWTTYEQGQRPVWPDDDIVQIAESRLGTAKAQAG